MVSKGPKHRKSPAPPQELKTPLSPAELEEFRQLLLEKRRAILGDVDGMAAEASRGPAPSEGQPMAVPQPVPRPDEGDDREITLNLLAHERMLLREIAGALERMEQGTYGLCLGTGDPIGKERLRARPWAKYGIEYARRLEKRRGIAGGPLRSVFEEEDEDAITHEDHPESPPEEDSEEGPPSGGEEETPRDW